MVENAADTAVDDEADVAVIGGGVSGLACAVHLRCSCFTSEHLIESQTEVVPPLRVLLVEAQPRLGGRIRSLEVGGYHVDGGAGWIHGITGNPLLEDGVLC